MNFSLKNTAYLGSLTRPSTPSIVVDSSPGFWFEADQITGASNNDAITSLLDLSGHGNTLTNAAGPAYKTNVIKGLPALLFDGVDDLLTRLALTTGTWSQPNTYLVVYRMDAPEGDNAFIFDSASGVARNARLCQPFATPDSIFLYAGGAAFGAITGPKNRWRVEVIRFNGSSSNITMNGVPVVWSPDPSTQGQAGLTIAAQFNSTTPARQFLSVVIGWNRLLSDTEVMELSTYYVDKYYDDSAYAGNRAYSFGRYAYNRFFGGGATAHPTAWSAGGWIKVVRPALENSTILLRSNGNPLGAWSHYIQAVSGVFRAVMFDGAGKGVIGTTTIVADQWYHVMATCVNSGFLRLYINGVSEGTPAAVGTMWTGGNDYWFGAATGDGVGSFAGSMTDMTIWNIELSALEVAALAGGSLGDAASLHSANHIVRLPMQDGIVNEAIGANWTESVGGLTQSRTADITVERCSVL